MKEDTMRKESTEITDIATAIESSLENLRTGLIGSKGFAIVFVSTTDDGTMHGGSVFAENQECGVTFSLLLPRKDQPKKA